MICPNCKKDMPNDSEFCPFCGETVEISNNAEYQQSIDNSSSCETSGSEQKKKRFTFKFSKPIIALSIVLVVLLVLNIVQLVAYSDLLQDNNYYCEELEESESKYDRLRSDYSKTYSDYTSLKNKYDDIYDEYDFYHDHAVIVCDDGTRYYHNYTCPNCDTSYFWIYNTEAARDYGYKPCPNCRKFR